MSKHIQVRKEFPGAETLGRQGYKRLARRVWQKVFPESKWVFRAMASEDFLWLDITIVDIS